MLGPLLVAAVEALVEEKVEKAIEGKRTPEFVTATEAAEILRCKPQRVYDLASSGRLPRFKESGRTLYRRADVLGLITPERGWK